MNKEISRRNIIKLLGVSGVTIPLTGVSGLTKNSSYKRSDISIKKNEIKLSSNENPYGPSEKVRNTIINAFDEACRYPYSKISELEKMIAEKENIDPKMVVVTGGSNEALRATGRMYGIEKKEIITCKPTYLALLTYAKEFGCNINWVPLDSDLKFDLDEIERRTNNNTSMLFICNPNNPSGTILDANKLKDFCVSMSKKTCVYVDEAYFEFSMKDGYPSMIGLVNEGHDMIVSRTFSKIYGLAGVRIGYMIASPEKTSKIRKYLMAGTNILAAHAAIAAYNEDDFFEYSLQKNKEGLNYFYQLFEELDLEYKKSKTNFVFFNSGHHIDKIQKFMKTKNILVGRPFPPYYDWCRISTGKMEDLKIFGNALKEFYNS